MQKENLKVNRESIIDYYNNFTLIQDYKGINKRHYSILNILINCDLKQTDHVLELGCGNGSFSSLISGYLNKGRLLAIDISPKSIEIARERLKKRKNIDLVAVDATTIDFGKELFNVIVLPDVIEHIPLDLHYNLFEKIANALKPDGFVFIHIPNPEYLEWCISNRPDLLQIIDQPITTDILTKNTYPHGLYIHELKTYSVWVKDGDYQYIVLRKRKQSSFSELIPEKSLFFQKVKQKIQKQFRKRGK